MTVSLRVAAVQLELRAEPDLEHFAPHVATVVGQAAEAGAELVVLPELASTGVLASDPGAASLRVADVPAAYRRIFPPCVEPIADVHLGRGVGGQHARARHQAPHVAGRHQEQPLAGEPDDLGLDGSALGRLDQAAAADRGLATNRLERHADHPRQHALHLQRA